jgi:hypothetical protein
MTGIFFFASPFALRSVHRVEGLRSSEMPAQAAAFAARQFLAAHA